LAPVTVLMTLMGLEIGGAETHAVVLARDLREMGCNVIVASGGGVYEEALRRCGIDHYKVPLDSIKASSVLRSLKTVKNVVALRKVNLIHAHARIPAFVSSLVARQTGTRFITTAHARFSTDFRFRYFSRWGEKTIAVSSDIRDHLIRHFGVPPENIVLIPNGVDTETFSPSAPAGDFLRELGLSRDQQKIVYVSRLDRALAPVAMELIKACESMGEEFPRLKLIVVGDGEKFGEVRAGADGANGRAGRELVRLLGARTDVNRIMAAGDLVVGASRVALEAMACARNVVLAGGEGFAGLIGESSLGLLEKDNFTGRLFKTGTSAEKLEASIREFFALSSSQRNRAGSFLRRYVIANHSSKIMAGETAAVYESVLAGR